MSEEPYCFSHEAMATTFQIFIPGGDRMYAQQAADAAFAEIDIIEKEISRFIDGSYISQINGAPADKWLTISEHTAECLKLATTVSEDTGGTFDITVGPLLLCWRNKDKSPRTPSPEELAAARALVGMKNVELDYESKRVRVKVQGVKLDMGGIGKGYAVQHIASILKEWDIDSALINGGFSSAYAFGNKEGNNEWTVNVGGVRDEEKAPYVLGIRNYSLSGSGTFVNGSHIIDPRTGQPAERRIATWSLHPNAAIADGLSTAFMIMSEKEIEEYCAKHVETSAMIVPNKTPVTRIKYGAWKGLRDA
jgi:thiamine biosynthesis lipoprotein